MHESSLASCALFIRDHLLPRESEQLLIADVGSLDVNGTYRPLFTPHPNWTYVGLDTEPGPNVDAVAPKEGSWIIEADDSEHLQTCLRDPLTIEKPYSETDYADWCKYTQFDVIISGQCLEHVEMPWVWIQQVTSILRRGGLIWITAPNTWCFHEYPKDCWRVWPDGLRALFDWAGLETIETYITGPEKYDTVGLARKPL